MKFTTAIALFAVGCTAHATQPPPSSDRALSILMFCTTASDYIEQVARRRDQGATLEDEEAHIDDLKTDPISATTLRRLAANPYNNRSIAPTILGTEAFKKCMVQN